MIDLVPTAMKVTRGWDEISDAEPGRCHWRDDARGNVAHCNVKFGEFAREAFADQECFDRAASLDLSGWRACPACWAIRCAGCVPVAPDWRPEHVIAEDAT